MTITKCHYDNLTFRLNSTLKIRPGFQKHLFLGQVLVPGQGSVACRVTTINIAACQKTTVS